MQFFGNKKNRSTLIWYVGFNSLILNEIFFLKNIMDSYSSVFSNS